MLNNGTITNDNASVPVYPKMPVASLLGPGSLLNLIKNAGWENGEIVVREFLEYRPVMKKMKHENEDDERWAEVDYEFKPTDGKKKQVYANQHVSAIRLLRQLRDDLKIDGNKQLAIRLGSIFAAK